MGSNVSRSVVLTIYCTLTIFSVASGKFRPSSNVQNRVIVAFDTASVEWAGPTIQLGFVFGILGKVRRSRDSGWLETTFVDSKLRIGRGNKGTLFVLTRDATAVQP